MTHRKEHTKAYRDSGDPKKRALWQAADDEAWAKKGGRPTGGGSPAPDALDVIGSQGYSNPELGAYAARYNTGSGYQDPDDPNVWTTGPSRIFGRVPNRFGIQQNLPQAGRAKSLSDYENDFYGLSHKELREFQEKAFRAGFYGTEDPSKIPWGDYDEDTLKVWVLMGQRSAGFLKAGKKITPQEALDMAIAGKPEGAGAEKKAGSVIRTTNPDLLRETIGNAVMEATGKRPDDGWIMQHVAQYQALERETQNQALNIGEAGGRGEVTDLPTPDDWAFLQVKKQRPLDVQAYQIGKRASEFFSLLGPPEGLS